jgi:hypothetical protein
MKRGKNPFGVVVKRGGHKIGLQEGRISLFSLKAPVSPQSLQKNGNGLSSDDSWLALFYAVRSPCLVVKSGISGCGDAVRNSYRLPLRNFVIKIIGGQSRYHIE